MVLKRCRNIKFPGKIRPVTKTATCREIKDKEIEVLEKLANAIQKNTEAISEIKTREEHVLNKLTATIQEM